MIRYFIGVIGVIVMLLNPIFVQAKVKPSGIEVYEFDKNHTNIIWYISHIGFSNSMGQFMDYEGQIILNHDNPELSTVAITIKTESIMTGLPEFDEHLRSSDFFDVSAYPTAKFISRKVTLLNDNKATVEGDFTLLGKTKPLTLKVRFNKRAMDIQKNIMRVGFSIKTTVKRSLWDMKKYLPFVGDDVVIRIEAEALKGKK